MTTSGVFTYVTGTSDPNMPASPVSIVAGPDGALWYTASGGIGRMETSGNSSFYPLSPAGPDQLSGLAVGPDGAIWFPDGHDGQIGRLTTSGVLAEYPLPASCRNTNPYEITAGSDGGMWFTQDATSIGRVQT